MYSPTLTVDRDTAVPRVAAPTASASASSAARLVPKPWRRSWRRLPDSAWKPASTRNAQPPFLRNTDPRASREAHAQSTLCAPFVHL